MNNFKIVPGSSFPDISVTGIDGQTLNLQQADKPGNWRLVVVYRGAHCPLCTRYLGELSEIRQALADLGVELIAVSADSQGVAAKHINSIAPGFPVGYGLRVDQMQQLGLFVSHPRSAEEAAGPFAEPGLFVINADGALQVVDISNTPFTRPNLDSLLAGLGFIKDPKNNYPIRGTLQAVA